MLKKILLIFLLLLLTLLFFFLFTAFSLERKEEGSFSLYFMEEKVGYEEYTWQSNERGYLLEVSGRMTKPIALEIHTLSIRLDKSFIPLKYYFKGSVSGVSQEITSSIFEGEVENAILVAGQETKDTTKIRRDAFLLPNAIFSPYVVLTKKFRCQLQEKVELSAYIIPQLEVPFSLEPKEESPCLLIMNIGGIEIELETDEEGNLKSLHIPSQRLKVIQKTSE